MEYLQELTASVKELVFFLFCFYTWDFFKLINIEEKKEIVILCCSTIFQLVFSYNLYF